MKKRRNVKVQSGRDKIEAVQLTKTKKKAEGREKVYHDENQRSTYCKY